MADHHVLPLTVAHHYKLTGQAYFWHPTGASPAWRQFLTSRASGILSCDFLHADTVFLKRLHVLFVTGIETWRVHIPGVTAHPTGARAAQQARNLLTDPGERAGRLKFLIRGRDSRFTPMSDEVSPATACRSSRLRSGHPRRIPSPSGMRERYGASAPATC